jgi:bacillithiol system protein YtxJ
MALDVQWAHICLEPNVEPVKERGKLMKTQFRLITSMDALNRLVGHSEQQPVALFKHDTACQISAAAYREMSRFQDNVAIVDVGRYNDIAQEIAARTGIEHESPQVIVFDGGKPVWSASHYDITYRAVAQALLER